MFSLVNILIFLTFVIGLIYIYFKRSYNYWNSRNVPHKDPIFPLGNLLEIMRGKDHIGEYFSKLCREFDGPYIGFYAFSKPFLIIKHPDIIKKILIKDFQIFSNRSFVSDEKIDPIMCNSLAGIRNPHWKVLRTKLSPIFTSGKIKMMMHLAKECGENLKTHIETVLDKNVEVKEIAAKYTTDVIASCAFGINANSFLNENSEFRAAGRNLFPTTPIRALKAFAYFFAPLLVRIFKFGFVDLEAVDFFRSAFMETITKREAIKFKRNDLIDILIDLKNRETKDDEFKFYGDRLVAQAVIFFSAGYETTSSTIALTLHELCLNTDIQDRIRKEIKEVIEKHGDLTFEGLQDMKYLHMAVCETLRKYPVTPFLQRECSKDYKIPETGLVIEKDIPVIIPVHGLHWDPKYFPNPEKYDPERFSDENKHNLTPYTYLPFGDGPRNCIGERFALMSSKLGIINIIQNFRVERSAQTVEPLIFVPSVLLQTKSGVQVTLRRLVN